MAGASVDFDPLSAGPTITTPNIWGWGVQTYWIAPCLLSTRLKRCPGFSVLSNEWSLAVTVCVILPRFTQLIVSPTIATSEDQANELN